MKLKRPIVMVIDDHYGSESSSKAYFYDKRSFVRDFCDGPYDFVFSTAFDGKLQEYTVSAALRDIEKAAELSGILLDIRFGDNEDRLGVKILKSLSQKFPSLPIVMMTSVPREELLSECLALGAIDYLVKPLQPEILWQTLDRYIGTTSCKPEFWLVGQTKSFLQAVDQVALAAEGGVTSVLLLGDSGTGKEVFAHYLHRHGLRCRHPFQVVHIAGMPETLMESELFGHRKGSFTGAVADRVGQFETANGGVVFLDEIGNLTPQIQAKLLRLIETREVTRIGDTQPRKIDIQLVAATNANLSMLVKSNEFRLDLYKRLAGVTVHLPSLNERQEDIPLLINHMLRRLGWERFPDQPVPSIPEEVLPLLYNRTWSGNVRDIFNYVQRVYDLARGNIPSPENFLQAIDTDDEDELSDQLTSHKSAITQAVAYADNSKFCVLEILSDEILAAPDCYLNDIDVKAALKKLGLLNSLLEYTRDRLSRETNRAKAVALLLKKKKCNTNEFDRRVEKELKNLPETLKASIFANYPDLVVGIKKSL